ncbi:hypothetical protein LTR53_015507 [Teratosphaeriaceae sp. CCFEE 6253]|nr:hypothetical protein LTR53_015507 [Teratosphaeriaceae sp. CCFEE 6253]
MDTLSTTAIVDPIELHRIVARLAPAAIDDLDGHLDVPSHYVIAVLPHDCDRSNGRWRSDSQSFIWIKGWDRVTVAKVRGAYIGLALNIGD